jgi:hypothetical protein
MFKPSTCPEKRDRYRLAYQREYRQRPEVRAREREYRREYRKRAEVIERRKELQNVYQRRYRAKPEAAARTLKRRREESRRHEREYWPRYRLACRRARERGEQCLTPEDLIAVGLPV